LTPFIPGNKGFPVTISTNIHPTPLQIEKRRCGNIPHHRMGEDKKITSHLDSAVGRVGGSQKKLTTGSVKL
jgi:hypothetical protein